MRYAKHFLIFLLISLPAQPAVSLVAHAIERGVNGATAGPIDTTGADFCVAAVSAYTSGPADDFDDSKGNTWTALTTYTYAVGFIRLTVYYTTPTSVGSGHTFTNTGTGNYTGVAAACFSGLEQSSVFLTGTDHGDDDTADVLEPILPGSVTTASGNLIISAIGTSFGAETTTWSISTPSGWTIIDQEHVSSDTEGVGLAYKISTGAAENPEWLPDGNSSGAVSIAAFAAVAAPAGVARRQIIQ